MLKIRLKRIGKKHVPHYRIVVIPARTKRGGKSVEQLGYYNPKSKKISLKVERAKHWLSVGAQPTDTVRSILAKHKLVQPKIRPKRPPKKPKKELKKQKEIPEEKKQEVKQEKKTSKPKEEDSKKNKKSVKKSAKKKVTKKDK